MGHYRYFLAIQTRLPDDYLTDAEFRRKLATLQRFGFDGIELNIREPETVDPVRLKAFLGESGLVLSMFASGLTAKTSQLSLATEDEARRKTSIARTVRFLEFAHEFGAGVIAGYLKGAPQDNGPGARERLAASVVDLAPVADRLKTPLLIEAVNRYESPVGHSLADTWDIARRANSPGRESLIFRRRSAALEREGAEMATSMVNCKKLGRELPGLTFKPFPNELGQRIYENVSQEAWKMWLEHFKMIMNEFRLSPADPRTNQILYQQAEQFFFVEGAQMPPDYRPPRSKG